METKTYLWNKIKTPCFVEGGKVQQDLKLNLKRLNTKITVRKITEEEIFGYERGWDEAMIFIKKQLLEQG